MIDLHVHTHHSCDSYATMAEYCEYALLKGVKIICFTDHVDHNPADEGFGYFKIKAYFDEFERVKEKYSDKLLILSGVEFAEPHIYQKEFDMFLKLPLDFILGSIHYCYQNMFPSTMVKQGISAETAYKNYWLEIYKSVSYGGFDSLAHFDFLKRYYGICCYDKNEILSIFKEMVKNNIALEINTSSLKKGLNEAMPSKNLLDLYRTSGGNKITIGGDTHVVSHLADGYEFAKEQSSDFESVFFKNRKTMKEV